MASSGGRLWKRARRPRTCFHGSGTFFRRRPRRTLDWPKRNFSLSSPVSGRKGGSMQPPTLADRQVPPRLAHEAGVTLVEVLAAIFVTGVGLLSLLALFPLGALEMARAIK